MHKTIITTLTLAAIVALSGTSAAQEPTADVGEELPAELEKLVREVTTNPYVYSTIQTAEKEVNEAREDVARIIDPHGGPDDGVGNGNGRDGNGDGIAGPGFGAALLGDIGAIAGIGLLGLAGLVGLAAGGMSLVSRYVDPKTALDNPQRSMLFGFIKGNPGVHLKQLSDDFDMKTSTVLWHVRKLEAAELVRSQKVNGYRVFYPVAGGIEAKQVGAAVAAVSNENALRILEYVSARPGIDQKTISDTLDINPGTVRWHLRKLRDRGILREISEGRASHYSPTDLGLKALVTTRGGAAPTTMGHTPVPTADLA